MIKKPLRRTFTVQYKKNLLAELMRTSMPAERNAILARERLEPTLPYKWRKQLVDGRRKNIAPSASPLMDRLVELSNQLSLILATQGRICDFLGISDGRHA